MPVDLDVLGAARREALKEPPEVIFKGEHFLLPVEPDGRILELLASVAGLAKETKDPNKLSEGAAAINELCKVLLGDEWERFNELHPSLMDLIALTEAFPELYCARLGGISGLAVIVAEHFGAVEADFQRVYGIDLRSALFGEERVGLRRVTALFMHLPPGSATWVALFGQGALWTTAHELAALQVEVTHHQTRVLAKVLGARHDIEPLKVPRPEMPEDVAAHPSDDVRRLSGAEDIAAFLGLMRQE